MKQQECEWMKLTASDTEASSTDDDQGSRSDSDRNSSPDEDLPQHSTPLKASPDEDLPQHIEPPLKARPKGQKITIDNIDYPEEVHHMTEDNR